MMYKLYPNNIYKECTYIRMNAYTYFKNRYVYAHLLAKIALMI